MRIPMKEHINCELIIGVIHVICIHGFAALLPGQCRPQAALLNMLFINKPHTTFSTQHTHLAMAASGQETSCGGAITH